MQQAFLPYISTDFTIASIKCVMSPSLFLICLLLFINGALLSQPRQIRFKQISSEQGLSNSTIEVIFQDRQGFMWFGTRDGLNRFDGHQMVVYRYSATDPNSISDNYIRCIFEDKAGTLWIGTSNGLNRFDARTGLFIRFQFNKENDRSLSNNLVTSIYEDKEGRLWVGTGNWLNLFRPGEQAFTRFRPENAGKTAANQIYCIEEDGNDHLWLGTENGLYRFNNKQGRFSMYEHSPSGRKTPTAIRVLKKALDGNLWLGTEDNGLYLAHPDFRTLEPFRHVEKEVHSLGSDLVRSILIDSKGSLWVGTVNGGLNLFLPNQKAFQHFQNEPDNPSSLSQRTVSALFEDKQGNIWVGTHRGGINVYTPNRQNFGLYRQEPNTNSLSYNDVRCFYEDRQGMIWIGTDGGGLNRFDPSTNKFKHYRYDPYNRNSPGSDEVLHITGDSDGNLWISTWGGGLNLLNPETGTFTRFLHQPEDSRSISSNYVQQVFEDDQKRLWVATYYGGLNLFDPKTKTFQRVVSDKNHLTHLMGNNFVSICQDAQKNIWFGTDDGGLNCLESRSQEFIHYFVNEEKMPDLRVLFVDSQGRLWVGRDGLYLFNQNKKTFSLFPDRAGLAAEFIKGITEDEAGQFWISTANGLTRLDPRTGMFKQYNTADGLQGPEFEVNAYLKTSRGQMFFGGINGFNAFYPKDIQVNRFVPPVYLTDFFVSNERIEPGDKHSLLQHTISTTREIKLSYAQASFSFAFAALNYIIPENNQYAYRLRGLDDAWNYVGNERKATYTNLAPRRYEFEVKAANNDGIWNETPTVITIIITPPFWNTWWFKTIIGFLLFAAAFAFLFLKRRYELQQLEKTKQEEMHQMQLQFFTNISHEFRTPLSLILGPLEKLQKEEQNKTFRHYYLTMHRNASRLLALVNELMDFRKVEAGVLKLKVMPGNLELFLQEIAEEFQSVAEEKSIRFSVQILDDFPTLWFDRQVLEKIIVNLISNSFKYTSSGGTITVMAGSTRQQLPISFSNELILKHNYPGKDYVYIQVSDNGIGISKDSIHHLFDRYYKISESHLGSGVGLAFVKSLTFLHKGSIQVNSERHRGTEIIIGLPISKDDYAQEEHWMQIPKEAVVKIESMDSKYETLPADRTKAADKRQQIRDVAKHILIVDDNEELRQFLRDSLSDQYQVWEAVDGYSGLVLAREKHPDLIISDVMMPGMNGHQFCKHLKEENETAHIPFIMLTAKAAVESKIEGIESGADFYFSKPLQTELLLLTIRNVLGHRQIIKEQVIRDLHSETRALVHSAKDKEFIDKMLSIMEEQLSNPELDVDRICKEIGMSRTKLHQTIKSITGHSISDFIRTVRLRKAVQIMTDEDVLITDVMYRVGMQTHSYFTKAFKKEFGKTPTQYLQDLKK
jgi:ligand-binding sensor domain-containing protein/signal transduction histidine kinase/DNA-binding response OmpR family regulator